METKLNVSTNSNSITIKGKSFNRHSIYTIEFKEPKGTFMAIFSNLFKYFYAMIFLIGIPMYFHAIYMDTKYHRIIIHLNEIDKKGNRKEKIFHINKDAYDYLIANY